MNIKDLEHNYKQLVYIELSIGDYYEGRRDLWGLVHNISNLVIQIKNVSDEWTEQILYILDDMGNVYGYMENENRTTFNEKDHALIKRYIADVRSKLDEYKKAHPEGSGTDEEYEEYMRLYPDDKL